MANPSIEGMFRGTLAQTSVPSRADELLTTALRSALQLVDVGVLDHILVAGGGHMSFAQRGLI